MNINIILDFLLLNKTEFLVKKKDLLAEVEGFLKNPNLKEYVYAQLKDKYVKEIKEEASSLLSLKKEDNKSQILTSSKYKDFLIRAKNKNDKNFLDIKFPSKYSQSIGMKYFFKIKKENFYAEYIPDDKSIFDEYFLSRYKDFEDFSERVQKRKGDSYRGSDSYCSWSKFEREFKDFVEDGNKNKFIKNSLNTQELSKLTEYFKIIFCEKDFDLIFQKFEKHLKDADKKKIQISCKSL